MLTFFRRIRKGLLGTSQTRKYLLYAIGEIALVVIGILIALQINIWNNSQIRNQRETEQLQTLKGEFELGVEHLKSILNTVDYHATNIDTLITILKSSGSKRVRISGTLLGSAIMWRTSDVSLSSLNTLIASGDLNHLSNISLRIKLAGLPTKLLDLTEDEIFSKEFSGNHMGPFLARQGLAEIAYSNRQDFKRSNSVSFTVPDEIEVVPNLEFIGLLTIRRVHFWYTQLQVPQVLSYIEELIDLINEELEKRK